MVKLILTGHGEISKGFKTALELVFGVAEDFSIVNFTQDITPELLEEKLETELSDETLIFADIAGGTPFKVASMISLKKPNIKVIGGMNMPMILEVLGAREFSDLNELYEMALETGASEIKGFELKKKAQNDDDFEDGI